jgi:hypothetical protein
MTSVKTVRAPKPASRKAKKAKQPKSELRIVEHKTLGVCVLRCIRALDSNDLVAVVEFSDGTERVIRLDECFWLTRITEMMQAPLEPARKPKSEPKPAKAADAADAETSELELNAGGHLGEIEDAADGEQEDSESGESSELAEV